MNRNKSIDNKYGNNVKIKQKLLSLNASNVDDTFSAPFYAEDVDHREVSTDILKLCNIIRKKHFKTSQLLKNSGLGGGANMNKYS